MATANKVLANRQLNGLSDRRWIVLTEDGRYSTIGRFGDPSEEEIARLESGLKAQGLAGWLAVQSHSRFAKMAPTVIEVRPLGIPKVLFSDAVTAFQALRAT